MQTPEYAIPCIYMQLYVYTDSFNVNTPPEPQSSTYNPTAATSASIADECVDASTKFTGPVHASPS